METENKENHIHLHCTNCGEVLEMIIKKKQIDGTFFFLFSCHNDNCGAVFYKNERFMEKIIELVPKKELK